jgi:hypothetical protein
LSAIPRLFAGGSLHVLATEALGERAYPTVCAAVVKVPGVGAPVPGTATATTTASAPDVRST